MKKNRMWMVSLILVVLVAACTPAAGTEEPLPSTGQGDRGQAAMVDEIEVLILESFPVQVNVVVRGNLPDGCTYLDEVEEQREGNVFELTLWTVRDPEAMCTMALVPFEHTEPLNVLGLEAGEYTVRVQDQTATFRLDVDNVTQE